MLEKKITLLQKWVESLNFSLFPYMEIGLRLKTEIRYGSLDEDSEDRIFPFILPIYLLKLPDIPTLSMQVGEQQETMANS